MMDMKEAIKFLWNKPQTETAGLLIRGEKFEAMWKVMQDNWGKEFIRCTPEDRYYLVNTVMNEFKEKYFPKK